VLFLFDLLLLILSAEGIPSGHHRERFPRTNVRFSAIAHS